MKKRIFSVLLCILVCLSMTPMDAFAEEAPDTNGEAVPFLYWDEGLDEPEPRTLSDYELVGGDSAQMWDGWYVLDRDITLGDPEEQDGYIVIEGHADLILKNNCTLTVYGRIRVNDGSELWIYAQSQDEEEMGSLIVEHKGADTGITLFGGDINLAGGKIDAINYTDGEAGLGGRDASVTVYDGIVKVVGGYNAVGIGGKGVDLITRGGKFTAIGQQNAAGIGTDSFEYRGGDVDAMSYFRDAVCVSGFDFDRNGKAIEITDQDGCQLVPPSADSIDISVLEGHRELYFRLTDWPEDRPEKKEKHGSATGPIVMKVNNVESQASEAVNDVDADPIPDSSATEADILPFKDVTADNWFINDLVFAYEKGLMEGVSADTFDPDGTVTRAQLAAMLYRAAKAEGNGFTGDWMFLLPYTDRADIPGYAYEAIAWCTMHDILKGYADGSFGPNDPITREQMAAILYRYAQYKGQGFAGASIFYLDYADAKDISEYAFEGMRWCVMKGIIGGVGNDLLAPQGNTARAQAAAILRRFCEAE